MNGKQREKKIVRLLMLCALILFGAVWWASYGVQRAETSYVMEQRQAAELLTRCFSAVRGYKEKLHIPMSQEDYHQTGMIGPYYTGITTTLGAIEAKRTTAWPDMGALCVRLLYEAGVRPGDRVAAAAAACLAVGLGSINFAAPAVAEQLPVVGSLFSWLNRGGQDDYVSLQSEQLNKYAETVESTAETADSPYTLTLGQVFNDGDWLRISLMLTSEDDSLAGFNAIGPREDAVEKALQNGGGQYGTLVLDNGTELNGAVTFEKRDDRTFVTGLNYELFLTNEDLAGHTATLTLSNLMACNKSIVETDGKSYWHYDYADQTPLPGTYTLTFTIPEVSDAGVRTMSTPVEQDGVTLQSIKATPAATKVLLTFPPEQHWVNVRLFTEDGTELGHERGEGGWWVNGDWAADPADFDHAEQCTKASYDYFAAVPENCHSLTVKVYDFDTDAELTTFTAELP